MYESRTLGVRDGKRAARGSQTAGFSVQPEITPRLHAAAEMQLRHFTAQLYFVKKQLDFA